MAQIGWLSPDLPKNATSMGDVFDCPVAGAGSAISM